MGRDIFHSTNLSYMKYKIATQDYHKPTLPFPLKHKLIMYCKFLPNSSIYDLGGLSAHIHGRMASVGYTEEPTTMKNKLVPIIPHS